MHFWGERDMEYHGHDNPINFPQDDFPFGVEFFARVLADFEVEVCSYVAHLLFSGHVAFVDTRVSHRRDFIFLFRHCSFFFRDELVV